MKFCQKKNRMMVNFVAVSLCFSFTNLPTSHAKSLKVENGKVENKYIKNLKTKKIKNNNSNIEEEVFIDNEGHYYRIIDDGFIDDVGNYYKVIDKYSLEKIFPLDRYTIVIIKIKDGEQEDVIKMLQELGENNGYKVDEFGNMYTGKLAWTDIRFEIEEMSDEQPPISGDGSEEDNMGVVPEQPPISGDGSEEDNMGVVPEQPPISGDGSEDDNMCEKPNEKPSKPDGCIKPNEKPSKPGDGSEEDNMGVVPEQPSNQAVAIKVESPINKGGNVADISYIQIYWVENENKENNYNKDSVFECQNLSGNNNKHKSHWHEEFSSHKIESPKKKGVYFLADNKIKITIDNLNKGATIEVLDDSIEIKNIHVKGGNSFNCYSQEIIEENTELTFFEKVKNIFKK